ncbi:MAG: M48 family metallopeptidase [Planctomycetota bacterium]
MPENQQDDSPAGVTRPMEEVRRYARRRYALFLGHLVVGCLFIVALILGGSELISGEALEIAGPRGYFTWVFFYFAGFSLAYLVVTLPLTFYREHVLERQFGLSTQTFGRWARRRLKKWVLSFVVAAPLALVIYATLRAWPARWWLPAAAVWIFFAYVLARFAPQILVPLFYKLRRVDNRRLESRLARLAEGAGLELEGAYRIDLSRETKKANAAVVGMGSSRRVVLGDTLLSRFTEPEVAVVFAHELGHIVHDHLAKGFAVFSGLIVVSLYVGSLVLHWASVELGIEPVGRSMNRVANPETMPLLIAVLAGVQLLVLPFEKWYSRRRERQSDAYALRATGDREAFLTAMKKLAALNLADVNPNKLAKIFLFSHPPILERIRFAKEFDAGTGE